jgi:hypothetical protein
MAISDQSREGKADLSSSQTARLADRKKRHAIYSYYYRFTQPNYKPQALFNDYMLAAASHGRIPLMQKYWYCRVWAPGV